jgi:ribosomal protein L23
MPTVYTTIRRPLITEKGLSVKETEGTLVFDVAPDASKTEVKQAVEALFKVKVAAVRTAMFWARSAGAASTRASGPIGKRHTSG